MRRIILTGTIVASIITGVQANPFTKEKTIIENLPMLKSINAKITSIKKINSFFGVSGKSKLNGLDSMFRVFISNDFKNIIIGRGFDAQTGMQVFQPRKDEIAKARKLQNESKRKQQLQKDKFKKSFILDKKYYNKEHLVFGSLNMKNSIVVISDPLCSACIDRVPKIFKMAKKKGNIAVYSYDFPLQMHPTAPTVVKLIKLAKKDLGEDIGIRVLSENFGNSFDVYKEKDNTLALKVFNEKFQTNYSIADLKNINIDDGFKIANDVKLQGTPTIVVNGSIFESDAKLQNILR